MKSDVMRLGREEGEGAGDLAVSPSIGYGGSQGGGWQEIQSDLACPRAEQTHLFTNGLTGKMTTHFVPAFPNPFISGGAGSQLMCNGLMGGYGPDGYGGDVGVSPRPSSASVCWTCY